MKNNWIECPHEDRLINIDKASEVFFDDNQIIIYIGSNELNPIEFKSEKEAKKFFKNITNKLVK